MNTGLESWNTNLLDVGPLYPFVGTESGLVIVGFVTWLVWHVLQARSENAEIADEQKYAKSEALHQALDKEEAGTRS